MRKSDNQRKNIGSGNQPSSSSSGEVQSSVVSKGWVNLDASVFLKRAHELKDEGNKRFQDKDYTGALEQYDKALKLISKTHPDRAVFHSNRAACLMQMKPVDYDNVINECTMALQVQPRYVKALLKRASAYEAIGKYEMAMLDLNVLLEVEPRHIDALNIAQRLRMAVRGAPVGVLGPILPARPGIKKTASPVVGIGSGLGGKVKKHRSVVDNEPSKAKHLMPKLAVVPETGSSRAPLEVLRPFRKLKLVYDQDIRLSRMPVNCNFKVLRETIAKRFPSSKCVLIKYKDSDDDLVTITCTEELRLAESFADSQVSQRPELDAPEGYGMLRLHVIEVTSDQEPPMLEEEENLVESEVAKGDDSVSNSSLGGSVLETPDVDTLKLEKKPQKNKNGSSDDADLKDVEMDDWLFKFAQLFRTHVGIDIDAHIDLRELGMELCSEALEAVVTSEESQILFNKVGSKFQEMLALALFNWGNVLMWAAKKHIPLDDSLAINPDLYEGLLSLGLQQIEMAKLKWSFALANQIDLSSWDPAETLKLFDSAEEKIKAVTEMWEILEEQRANKLKAINASRRDEHLNHMNRQLDAAEGESSSSAAQREITPDEVTEQAAMRSQIHQFWGKMLFERSQIECKLGIDGWQSKLDASVEHFKLAGTSEGDIALVLMGHSSNADKTEEKMITEIASTSSTTNAAPASDRNALETSSQQSSESIDENTSSHL